MNSNTGAIAHFENWKDAKDAGYDIPLTPVQAETLTGMNRRERRKWAAEERARHKRDRKLSARGG